MMYGSWDIERNWPNRIFCHFRHFLPFYSTNNSKNFEKMKKYTWTNHHFTQEYQKSWSYAILLLRYSTWGMELLYFILGYFYSFNPPPLPPLFPPNSPKKEKTPEDIIILHMCTKNYDQMMYGSWDIVCDGRTDGRTDGKSDI